jgi:hypothetical protein
MRKWMITSLAVLGAAHAAHAANNSTDSYHEIRDLVFWSSVDAIYPEWQGYVSVAFTQPLTWTTTGVCNQTTVAIRPADKHMISAVQTALASGKPVRLYVDDAQRIAGTYCILRAVQY